MPKNPDGRCAPDSPRPSAPPQTLSTSGIRTWPARSSDCVAILGADLLPRVTLRRLDDARRVRAPRTVPAPRSRTGCTPTTRPRLSTALLQSRGNPASTSKCGRAVQQRHRRLSRHAARLPNLLDHPDVQGIIVRAADETVFDREARWRTLVGESPIGIYEIDLEGHCSFVNPMFARLTNLSATDACRRRWSRGFMPTISPR